MDIQDRLIKLSFIKTDAHQLRNADVDKVYKIMKAALTYEKAPVATSPAEVPGYVASWEKACLDIYMGIHVSEIKNFPTSIRCAWSTGQEIWTKLQDKDAT